MSLRVTCPHQNIEVVEDRVYFSILRRIPQSSNFVTYFTIEQDPKYAYAAFFDDFGPPSILQLTEFYRYLVNSINDVENEMKQKQGKTKLNIFQANNNTAKSFHQSIIQSSIRLLHFYTSPNPISCANAVMYISFFRMIYLNLTAEEAFKPFKPITKYICDYRDASTAPSIFELKIIDVLRGIKHVMELKWYDPFTFDSAEWDNHQQIKNGDMNWIIPNKLLAFASPYSMNVLPSGDVVATPETVIPTFKEFGITRIVRLNKKYYDAELFTNEGFQFTELYFLDGSIPPPNILQTWLSIIETDGEVVALHCKAGLGRTYVI